MKLRHSILMCIVGILAASCDITTLNVNDYNEDGLKVTADFQAQIDELKKTTIATIQGQITNINTSIESLKKMDTELKGYIDALEESLAEISQTQSGQQDDIDAAKEEIGLLKKADEDILAKIDELQDYVSYQLNAQEDWANATFATLEEQEELAATLAAIELRVEACEEKFEGLEAKITEDYKKAIASAIAQCETDMQAWVNDKLTGYYTVAAAEAKLAELESQYKDGDKDIQDQIDAQKTALTTAEADLKTAYTEAIKTSITELEGTLNTKIATDIATATTTLNGKITDINTEITNIKSRLDAIEAKVKTILSRVQSVAVVPTYSDGSVKVENTATQVITFDVMPAGVLDSLVNKGSADMASNFKFAVVKTRTKGDTSGEPSLPISKAEVNSAGQLELTADATKLGDEFFAGTQAISASLVIDTKDGATSKSSEYFALYFSVTIPVTGVTISETTATVGKGSNKTLTYTVEPAGATVESAVWSSSAETVASVDQNGVVTGVAEGTATITITVNGTYTATCTVTVPALPEGALPGKFSVSADKQVYFSKGNLQATVNASGTPTAWNFAADQYGYIGNAAANNSIGTTAGVVDLFCWSTDAASNNWGIHTKTGTTTGWTSGNFKDWGKNPIANGGNTADLWKTLSSDEWTYLLNTRTSSTVNGVGNARYCKATVNSIAGLILFPDSYTHPAGVVAPTRVNESGAFNVYIEFTVNIYSSADWTKMESAGCVFLPAAGYRAGASISNAGSEGDYWSATPDMSSSAYRLCFKKTSCSAVTGFRYRGYSVRLVYSAAPSDPVYPEAPELACVKIGDVWWAPVNCGYDATHTYGSLYQWGRKYGQAFELGTITPETMVKSDDTAVNSGKFGKSDGTTCNWFSGAVDNTLWNGGSKGTSDPCPDGWRVPTEAELEAITSTKSWTTTGGPSSDRSGYLFGTSPNQVFLPAAGSRDSSGSASYRDSRGRYWSSSVEGDSAKGLRFSNGSASMNTTDRALGYSVRCVKE